MRLPIFMLALLLLAGCEYERSPEHIAQQCVDDWNNMGMYVPADQVPFFAANFAQVSDVLEEALGHPNVEIRQRAAYVVDELGPQARDLQETLVKRVRVETSRLVRLYLYDALRSVASAESSAIDMMREKYAALPDDDSKDFADDLYTARDERIALASALHVLDPDRDERPSYLQEVTRWLERPADKLTGRAREMYWEHRWSAVMAIEKMHDADEALPLLQAMLEEEGRPSWVPVHVPRAIEAVESNR